MSAYSYGVMSSCISSGFSWRKLAALISSSSWLAAARGGSANGIMAVSAGNNIEKA